MSALSTDTTSNCFTVNPEFGIVKKGVCFENLNVRYLLPELDEFCTVNDLDLWMYWD